MQILQSSPVATEYNMAFTLSVITVVGIVTAMIGLIRREKYWRVGFVTIALNIAAWWWTSRLTEWAFNPPPGIDY